MLNMAADQIRIRVQECMDMKTMLMKFGIETNNMKSELNEYIHTGRSATATHDKKSMLARSIEALSIYSQLQQLGCLLLPNIHTRFGEMLNQFVVMGDSCSDKLTIERNFQIEIRLCSSIKRKSGLILLK